MKDNKKGITLIALVVTIIVMIILSGIVVYIIIGDNGIFSKTLIAIEKHEEERAREKLELVLSSLELDKNTIENYDKEYIDNELINQGMIVIEDIVVVDNWQFEIDREVPKIITSLGKGTHNENILLTAKGTTRDDYVNATIKVNIQYNEGKISEIQINKENKEVPNPKDGVYTLEETVTENGIYTILVKDEEKNYKIAKVLVNDLTEDMDIWTREDMENFRGKVNSGRTFEGKTARVMNDIDLQGAEDNKWIPIGDYTNNSKLHFKGTFEGNNHQINNLYINTTLERVGLFGNITGEIKNITVSGNITSTANFVGGIGATASSASKISNCINKTKINGKEYTGGILGYSDGQVQNCTNEGEISGTDRIGGIIGEAGNARNNFKMYKYKNNYR